jgi:hypothetical protein
MVSMDLPVMLDIASPSIIMPRLAQGRKLGDRALAALMKSSGGHDKGSVLFQQGPSLLRSVGGKPNAVTRRSLSPAKATRDKRSRPGTPPPGTPAR